MSRKRKVRALYSTAGVDEGEIFDVLGISLKGNDQRVKVRTKGGSVFDGPIGLTFDWVVGKKP